MMEKTLIYSKDLEGLGFKYVCMCNHGSKCTECGFDERWYQLDLDNDEDNAYNPSLELSTPSIEDIKEPTYILANNEKVKLYSIEDVKLYIETIEKSTTDLDQFKSNRTLDDIQITDLMDLGFSLDDKNKEWTLNKLGQTFKATHWGFGTSTGVKCESISFSRLPNLKSHLDALQRVEDNTKKHEEFDEYRKTQFTTVYGKPDVDYTPTYNDTSTQKSALRKYARNLNQLVKNGKLDKGIGREDELHATAMILSKRKKGNPLLIGEAGIGKSQTVYDLAHLIESLDYKGPLKGKTIYEVSTTSLVAGCSYVGMSEKRMQDVLREAEDPNVILFWDEIHTMLGAGAGKDNNNDLANMVKPALADGRVRCIGATTAKEAEIIYKDKALERRFNKVIIHKLTEAQVVKVIKGLAPIYERHHGIVFNGNALKLIPKLSKMSGMNDPDASIDLLDTIGAIKANSPDRWSKGGNKVTLKDVRIGASILYSVPLKEVIH